MYVDAAITSSRATRTTTGNYQREHLEHAYCQTALIQTNVTTERHDFEPMHLTGCCARAVRIPSSIFPKRAANALERHTFRPGHLTDPMHKSTEPTKKNRNSPSRESRSRKRTPQLTFLLLPSLFDCLRLRTGCLPPF
jgi:hypothetical protein